MSYSFLSTQFDHIKVIASKKFPQKVDLVSEEDHKHYVDYIKDIVQKISEKGRKYKMTVKKKYILDGLITPSSKKISSVYVIMIVNSPSLFFADTSSFE
mmetsp:Transcript_33812/g.32896  ORF Transcript_33812/g.32896 Transcript_33812/m.32896 type:complete len:99 (-) Transcript_33812:2201-2497(-)